MSTTTQTKAKAEQMKGDLNMNKNYVFCEFDGNVGCEEWLDSKEKALDYANYSWNHTTEKEKASLEYSFVIEVEKTKEEVEDLPGWVGDYATATIWEKGKEI